MKIPKTVDICGKTFSVCKDKNTYLSHGDTWEQRIIIGVEEQGSERKFDALVHEIAELVCCEKNYRYGDGHSERSVFVMNHKEFEHFISAVAVAIYPMIKEK